MRVVVEAPAPCLDADRLYRLGCLQYQAALVDRACEAASAARRARRRAAAQLQTARAKQRAAAYFDRLRGEG